MNLNIAETVMNQVYKQTLEFIKSAHDGQMYGDKEYWTHPVAVAKLVRKLGGSDDAILAALMHDVVEDTDYSLNDLTNMGYSKSVVDIVNLLTKRPGSYQENIQRIINSGNKDAMIVKLADNIINMSGDKSHMSHERRERLLKKYDMPIRMLSEALGLRP